jgi:hypothetical protein
MNYLQNWHFLTEPYSQIHIKADIIHTKEKKSHGYTAEIMHYGIPFQLYIFQQCNHTWHAKNVKS